MNIQELNSGYRKACEYKWNTHDGKPPRTAVEWISNKNGNLVKHEYPLYYDILGEPHANPKFCDVSLCGKFVEQHVELSIPIKRNFEETNDVEHIQKFKLYKRLTRDIMEGVVLLMVCFSFSISIGGFFGLLLKDVIVGFLVGGVTMYFCLDELSEYLEKYDP